MLSAPSTAVASRNSAVPCHSCTKDTTQAQENLALRYLDCIHTVRYLVVLHHVLYSVVLHTVLLHSVASSCNSSVEAMGQSVYRTHLEGEGGKQPK